nr:immunoglobulin heavy chain junction region [Mus musculus]
TYFCARSLYYYGSRPVTYWYF